MLVSTANVFPDNSLMWILLTVFCGHLSNMNRFRCGIPMFDDLYLSTIWECPHFIQFCENVILFLSSYIKEMPKTDTEKIELFIDKYFGKSYTMMKQFKLSQMQKTFANNFHKLIMDAQLDYFNETTMNKNGEHEQCKNFGGIPEVFRQNIINTLDVHRVYTFNCNHRIFNVTFYADKNKTYTEKKWENYIRRIYIWLQIACQFAPKTCATRLNIHIFMADIPKKAPTSQSIQLDRVHANSAFTSSCVPNTEIVIYRKEEWFKVFIHETFHSLGLDFSRMDTVDAANRQIEEIFRLESSGRDFKLYESYAETWAEIIHIFMVAHFQMLQEKTFVHSFVENVETLLRKEITFSMIQCTKVLHHNGMNYNQLMSGEKHKYRENTAVFSYYIIKCALLFNMNEFVQWTMMQNHHSIEFKKYLPNVIGYVFFIAKCSQNQHFINMMTHIEYQYKLMKSRHPKMFGATTMRMTMIE